MPVSPTIFRHAFNRFQSIHEQESGKPLDNFSEPDSLAYEWEDYKREFLIGRWQFWNRRSGQRP